MDPTEAFAKKAKSKGRMKAAPDPELSWNENKQEEASSLNNDQLQDFREKWKKELQLSIPGLKNDLEKTTTLSPTELQTGERSIPECENTARSLFLRGIDMEKKGKLYEAIQFYRRAIQMVPDIESKLQDLTKVANENNYGYSVEENYESSRIKGESYCDRSNEINLLPKIKKKMTKVSSICIAKSHQETTHISVLPIEIILYILRWLVSSELDLRSLEMFSEVCRGFYLCARDSEIWRLACLKVWGIQCGESPESYRTWRQMFIDRSRLRFNGCYISKTTYIRHGENNFQDEYYRPWHLIAYFRYLRFFPEGVVLMLTSSDEPSQCISQLRHRNNRIPVLSGYYRLRDDRVTVIVHRQNNLVIQNFKRNKNKEQIDPKQSFHLELQILNHRNKKHFQLQWIHYSIRTITRTGEENVCAFDLVNNKFPPFWFSRVKSYTMESENAL